MRLILFIYLFQASRVQVKGPGFFQLWGGFSLSEANQASELWRDPLALSGLVHFSLFRWTALCSASLPMRFICQGLCFEICWRWTEGTESELRKGLGPLVSRFLGGGLTLKMEEGEVIQLLFKSTVCSLFIWLSLTAGFNQSVSYNTWPKVSAHSDSNTNNRLFNRSIPKPRTLICCYN